MARTKTEGAPGSASPGPPVPYLRAAGIVGGESRKETDVGGREARLPNLLRQPWQLVRKAEAVPRDERRCRQEIVKLGALERVEECLEIGDNQGSRRFAGIGWMNCHLRFQLMSGPCRQALGDILGTVR